MSSGYQVVAKRSVDLCGPNAAQILCLCGTDNSEKIGLKGEGELLV